MAHTEQPVYKVPLYLLEACAFVNLLEQANI
jgi:hypothetical protein